MDDFTQRLNEIESELFMRRSEIRPSPPRIDELKGELWGIAEDQIEDHIADGDLDSRDCAIRAVWLLQAECDGHDIPTSALFELGRQVREFFPAAAYGQTADELRKRIEAAVSVVHRELAEQYGAFQPLINFLGIAQAVGELSVENVEDHTADIGKITAVGVNDGYRFWVSDLAKSEDGMSRMRLAGGLLDGLEGEREKHEALAVLAAFDSAAVALAARKFSHFGWACETVSGRDGLRAYFRAAFDLLSKTVKDEAAVRVPHDVYVAADFARIDREALEALTPMEVISDVLDEAFPTSKINFQYADRLHACGMSPADVRVWLEDARDALAAFTDDDGRPMEPMWDAIMPVPKDG